MSYNDVAIKIEGVSKRFELYDTPRDQLKQFILPKFQRMIGLETKLYFREFWSLRDISLEIKKGETVGVIGRNGAGKSTLLQILCGVLTPSIGKVEVSGRVGALLELGAGFNPEFTGRENVYMNANILGMKTVEIDGCFDKIIAFADIGDFIDMQVKTYSSGMFVRLAFAVIAHVNAEILIIDEALAVGDILFTQKCMRFLREFMETGTVLFVSHDLPSVKNLCKRTLWLENGKIMADGDSDKVCDLYYQHIQQEAYGDKVQLETFSSSDDTGNAMLEENKVLNEKDVKNKFKASVVDNSVSGTGWKTGEAEILSIVLEHIDQEQNDFFAGGERVCMSMRAKSYSSLTNPILGFIVKDHLGQELFGENTLSFTKEDSLYLNPGEILEAKFIFNFPVLQDGQYVVMASFADGDSYEHTHHHYIYDALIINVYCSRISFGIMSIPFESVSLKVVNNK